MLIQGLIVKAIEGSCVGNAPCVFVAKVKIKSFSLVSFDKVGMPNNIASADKSFDVIGTPRE